MENRYYYHGIEPFPCIELLGHIHGFIKSGVIKTREHARRLPEGTLPHVCLVKNAEESEKQGTFYSAKGEWIDNCIVFIINPENLDAYKAYPKCKSALMDEWRVDSDIPFSEVVGIALPHGEEFFNDVDHWTIDAKEVVQTYLNEIKAMIEAYGWFIEDSSDLEFTERLDKTLNENKTYNL
jgi:hypothetical protein